jgi:PCI domain
MRVVPWTRPSQTRLLSRRISTPSIVQARELLEAMTSGHYGAAFATLARLSPLLCADLHAAPCLGELARQIRRRALTQHVRPFESLRLADMAAAFGTTIGALLPELVALVVDGSIPARIDAHNQVRPFPRIPCLRKCDTQPPAPQQVADDCGLQLTSTVEHQMQRARCCARRSSVGTQTNVVAPCGSGADA